MFYCAASLVQYGQSCFAGASSQTVQNSQDYFDCITGAPQPYLDCLTTPNTGFNDCIANLGCGSVCGANGVEPGEDCDDGNTNDGDGCSSDCYFEDADQDGILDDGNGSTVPGDAPCPDGVTVNCDDNCPTVANPGQEDSDGDLTGDACDANCSGTVTGSTISGTVYANTAIPANVLAGVQLSACQTGTTCCSYATTDSNGLYQFTMLDDGSYDIVVFAPGNFLPAASTAPISVSGTAWEPGHDFVLQGPATIPPGVTITNAHTDFGIPFIAP